MTERKRVQPHSSLRAWRKSHGYAQRQAAAVLGISQSYLSKLEQGQETPRPKIAKRLMDTTGVPLDVLLGIAS